MGFIYWIIMGLVAGVLAKLIMPGKDPGGVIITILVGIAGAFVGGLVGQFLGIGAVTGFQYPEYSSGFGRCGPPAAFPPDDQIIDGALATSTINKQNREMNCV